MNCRNKNEQLKESKYFENLKSDFILKKIFNIIKKKKSLEIMKYNKKLQKRLNISINPLASPSGGAPALNYGDVNTETPSPGEVKGLNIIFSSIELSK